LLTFESPYPKLKPDRYMNGENNDGNQIGKYSSLVEPPEITIN